MRALLSSFNNRTTESSGSTGAHENMPAYHFTVLYGCVSGLVPLEIPYTNNALSTCEAPGQGAARTDGQTD